MEEKKDEVTKVAYKTKLKNVTKEQHKVLLHHARISDKVKNWYVRYLLEEMKKEGITAATPWEEIRDKYHPRKVSTVFTKVKKEDPKLYDVMSVSSHVANGAFEDCVTNWKERTRKGFYVASKYMEEKKVDYFYSGKKKCEATNLYKIKGFPAFRQETREKAFSIRDVVFGDNNTIILPVSIGNKKLGVKGVTCPTLEYYEKDTPLDKTLCSNKNSITNFKYDGRDWWVCVKVPPETLPKKYDIPQTVDEKYSLGIDIGIKTAITCSNGITHSGLHNDPVLKELFVKERVLQRKMSKNLALRRLGTYTTPYGKTKIKQSQRYKNYKKQHDKVMVAIERRKKHVLETFSAQFPWNDISRVVVEDLSVAPWFKNRKWASKLQKSAVKSLLTYIKNQAEKRGIAYIEVKQDKNFASSQLCPVCGHKNAHMKNLSKRTFVCEACGHKGDRDHNAAVNLANFDRYLDRENSK